MFPIIPRMPGMKALYQCKKCHKTFLAAIPVFDFFGLVVKCSHCGSRNVIQDNKVVY
jgi:DNA-directed RNA polymerase subunit RPC12/RpoP